MATTKRHAKGRAERPTIGSSHTGRTGRGARGGAGPADGRDPASKEGGGDGAGQRGPERRPSSGIARPSGTKSARKATPKHPRAGAKGSARPATHPKPKPAAGPRPTFARRISRTEARTDLRSEARTDLRTEASPEARAIAVAIAAAALDKKAVNVQIIDVVGRVDYADFLVLMSGRSDRHVLSIADGIEEHLVKPAAVGRKVKPTGVEGREHGYWVVLDFADVIAHVFQEEARAFYDLDALWQDARRVPVATA